MSVSPARIQLQIANFRTTALHAITDAGDQETATSFADLLSAQTGGVTTSGRNMALNDPESAYRMMTKINNLEALFKAQHAELNAMGQDIQTMGDTGNELAAIDPATENAAIAKQMQSFVDQYNAWESRFDQDVEHGGLLENVQAAATSRNALEQSLRNIFNGSVDGVYGMGDLGVRIDPATRQATFDRSRLDAVLATDKQAAVAAIDAFSADFAETAKLLTSDDNVIHNQLANRERAIDFIAGNRSSLESEFGTGNAARPQGDVARALAVYNATAGLGG